MKAPSTADPAAAKPPYDHIKEAYGHLAKQDAYQPYEERDDKDWVLVFFHETLTARLFRTLEDVGRRYAWDTYRHNVYVKPAQFATKFTTVKLTEMCKGLGLDIAGKTAQALAQQLWDHCQSTGDRVTNGNLSGASNAADEDKYMVHVSLLKDPDMAGLIDTLPKQAKIIASSLAEAEKSVYTEDELISLSNKLVGTGKMQTKQDPFRVVRYYLPTLAGLGLVTYNSRRTAGEDKRDPQAA